jgi:hypothetical protein
VQVLTQAGLIRGIPFDSNINACYLPNAAIAWKQPNGFYYPPAFHSKSLFFDKVDIRHFVIEPLFDPELGGPFITDPVQVQGEILHLGQRYCLTLDVAGQNGMRALKITALW